MPFPAPKPLAPPSLDITPRPLSVRSLDYRRSAADSGSGVSDVISRVRGEFVEMHGFSPTIAQAARLFDLTPDECTRVLGRLVSEGFLRCTADGRYRRLQG